MSIIQKGTCIECGKLFATETENRGRPRMYCSAECQKARSKRESSNLLRCRNCGKEFASAREPSRICCSKACAVADIRRQTADWKSTCSHGFREWAVSLCLDGYGCVATADALGISQWTLKGWIRQYKDYGRTSGTMGRYSYLDAQNPCEWIERLRLEATPAEHDKNPITDNRRIFLVCGRVKGKRRAGRADQLAIIVEGRLQMDPFDGSVYAFCGGRLAPVFCMYWDGAGFFVVTRRCEHGTYPWPSPQLGKVMPVTPEDLEIILSGRGKKPVKA